MATGAKKYPDFFKVHLPEEHSQRMLIPINFVKLLTHLQERLPEEVILRDHRSGRDWHVNARPIGGKLYFDNGWKKFREENLLETADFLVFTYDGTNLFKFKLFDQSGCEKIKEDEQYGNETDSVMKLEEMEIVQEKTERKGKSIVISDDEEEEEDEDYEMEEEEEEETKDDWYDLDGDDWDNFEDTEMEVEYDGNMSSHCKASKALETNKRATAATSSPKAKDPEHEDYELHAEMCVHPDNPYFIVEAIKDRPNVMRIPGTVIQDFSLRFPEEITLLSCNCQHIPIKEALCYHLSLPQLTLGRRNRLEAIVKVRKWKDRRLWVQGWERFSRKNRIKENNVCICEIVMREDKMVEMLKVHIR